MLNKNSFNTKQYSIETFHNYYLQGRVNLSLDIQRSYLWSEEKQQNLWDTLLIGFRIPEIHAIVSGNCYEIIDGKQRLTTIFKIRNNEIPFKKSFASKELKKALFSDNCNKIFYRDLPQELKYQIDLTELSVSEYNNLSKESEDYAILFRKINSGEPLSELAQGLSKNILIRTHFTNILLEHSIFNSFSLTNTESNTEKLELALIRYLGLRKYGSTRSLDTKKIPYEDFTIVELSKYCTELYELLTKINNLSTFQKNRSKQTGLPFLLWGIKEYNLQDNNIQKYIKIFSDNYASDLSSDRNFDTQKINLFKNYMDLWYKEMLEINNAE